MSQQAVTSPSLSRPKVHRLPLVTVKQINPAAPFLGAVFSLFVMFVGAGFWVFSSIDQSPAFLHEMGVSKAIASVKVMPANTIVIKDDKQAIIGQLSKIPVQNQKITGIQSVSNTDSVSNAQLLSIVSKH